MAIINPPPTGPVDTMERGALMPPSEGWRNFFHAAFGVCNAMTLSGTTAQRPTSLLWVGRFYWDTTLGKPIWLKSVLPTVWVDATGAAV